MAVRLRSVSAIAALALTAAVAPVASTPAEAAAVVGVGSAGATVTVSVHGRLVVVPAETPGGRTAYGVALSGGDIVPVRGHFDPDARTGDHVQARLALPSSIASSLPGTAGTAVTAGSDAGRTALRLVDRREETLRLAGEPSVTAPTAAAVTPVQHQQYVAAVDNLGALGQTDAELLGHVSTVGSYWKGESEGAISISVPGAVRHYRTSLPTTDCGLGDDFFNVVDDAEAQFPGIDPFSGTDQLVLFVPPTCASGSTVGMGSIGVSFASGGVLVVKAGNAINGTYAHETGHNYGFGHANARIGADSLEYYGVYDVMGFAIGGFNQLTALSTPYRVFQGITQPGEVQAVPLGDGSAPMQDTVTIKPRSDDTGVRSVRVTDPDTGEALYLDYRTGTGQDAGSFYATPGYFLDSSDGPLHYAPGVVVTAAHDISGVDDFVTSDTGDTSTPAGGTWSNESGSLLVHVTAASSTSATVTISYAPSGDWATVGTPTIAGDLEVGGSATLDIGTWSPTPAAVQVRWAADGQPVPGTDDQQAIALGPDLAGKSLSAAVTAFAPGRPAVTVSSGPVPVAPGTVQPISPAPAPSIAGTPRVGSPLGVTTGTWMDGVTLAYQWYVDGTAVTGATGTSYIPRVSDLGKTMHVEVTGSSNGYSSVTTRSTETTAVRTGVLHTARPRIVGTAKVGRTLTARHGTWTTGTTFTYAWYANGKRILHKNASTLKLARAQKGKRITVKVTGHHPGYQSASRVSARTATVR